MSGYLRFFRRKKVAPGTYVNVSKTGPGISLRILPGVVVGFSLSRGFYFSLGVPGTGLSYRGKPGKGK